MTNMKKLIFTSLLLPSVLMASTNEFDLKKGIDFTGVTGFTPSQLNQLVDNATTATNKGMIIATNATPDVGNNSRYTNFIWLDISYQPPRAKVYNSTAGTWNEIISTNVSIPDGSITSAKIANGTILSEDISDGTIASTDLSTSIVTSNYLANNSVYTAAIIDGHVTTAKLATGAVGSSAQIAAGIIQSNDIAADAILGELIANLGINAGKLNSNSVVNTNIVDGTITGSKLALQTVGYTNLANNSVSNNAIINGSITTNKFDTNILNRLPLYATWLTNASGGAMVQSMGVASINNFTSGKFLLTFSAAMSTTNYAVVCTEFGIAANDSMIFSAVSNTLTTTTIYTRDEDGGGIEQPGTVSGTGGFSAMILGY